MIYHLPLQPFEALLEKRHYTYYIWKIEVLHFVFTLSHESWFMGSLIANLVRSRDSETLKLGETVEKPFLDVPELRPSV